MIVAFVVVGIALFTDGLLIVLSIINHQRYNKVWDEWPQVSILLAARNEENVIARCIDSLVMLDYPMEKLQVLIGDDNSNDGTSKIIQSYADKHHFINAVPINKQVGEQKGKANVLAQLALQATGEYYFFTDADIQLPKSWIKGMLQAMEDEAGLAIGVTCVEDSKMQDLDWLHALGMVKVMTDLNMPVTGVGNNMVVSKSAYKDVGGYENLPFSITEDYELFKHIKKKGFRCLHVFHEDVLGRTLPASGFVNLLNQRKRWMMGALGLPWHIIGVLLLQPLFYACLFFLLLASPVLVALLFVIKIVFQVTFIGIIRERLKLPFRLLSVIIYEMYAFFIAISSGLYFLIPTRVKWKGREY